MTAAKKFALRLDAAFARHSCSKPFGEIRQFQALMAAFADQKEKYLLEEYHGSKHQVYFDTSVPYLRPRARCELCDILIIAFSRRNGFNAKATFLQAKISTSIYPKLRQTSPKVVESLSFAANLEQWDLLANRPILHPTTIFHPPPHLLSAAQIPSIGSFGVFYLDRPNSVSFFYCAADYLRPRGNPYGKFGRLETTSLLPNRREIDDTIDTPYCNSILTFGLALCQLNIGAPLVRIDAKRGRTAQEPLNSWIAKILTTYATVGNPNSVAAHIILREIGRSDQPIHRKAEPIPSLLLLDVDGR